jgi:hypothetical protein
MDAKLLTDEYTEEKKFAEDNNVHQRTVARYRNQPDGLPYVMWGGRVFIHVPRARQWLESRVRHLNPSRERR